MSSPAVTVRADATLPQAARLMAEHRVKRLPVVDEQGILKDIVSRSDLLKVFLRTDEDLAAEVRRDVVDRFFSVSARQQQMRNPTGVAQCGSNGPGQGPPAPLASCRSRPEWEEKASP